LRQHGNFALAYSVMFQPRLEHFGDEAGFLSYKTVGSTALVLSNPVAAYETQGRYCRNGSTELLRLEFAATN
jgi:lysylphosphatidylglycerol synthetase-like protein (DUF2156 family)